MTIQFFSLFLPGVGVFDQVKVLSLKVLPLGVDKSPRAL